LSPSVADWTFLFLEAAPVSARFRAAEAGFGWAVVLACSAEVHSVVPEVDFRELADGFRALVVDSPSPVDDFLARVAGFHAPVADFLERVDEQAVDFPAPVVDFLVLTAAFWTAEAPACSPGVHCFAPAAHSREPAVDCHALAAGSLALADEPGVELLVPVADFRARVAACGSAAELADSTEARGAPALVDGCAGAGFAFDTVRNTFGVGFVWPTGIARGDGAIFVTTGLLASFSGGRAEGFAEALGPATARGVGATAAVSTTRAC
jgi:hypothetical protein